MSGNNFEKRGVNYAYAPQPPKKKNTPLIVLRIIVIVLLIASIIMGIIVFSTWRKNNKPVVPPSPSPIITLTPTVQGSPTITPSPQPTPSQAPYTEMTLLSVGDVMYHGPQISAAHKADGEYDFTSSYQYVKPIISAADYAVANFETTLAGPDLPYRGWPAFNAPDQGLEALADAGFDMMLFANNHCYDTKMQGVTRTQQMFEHYGLDYIGARKTPTDKSYRTVTVNGITLGMINTTDDIAYGNLSPRTFNNVEVDTSAFDYLDSFNHSLLAEFYSQTKARIAELKAQGADLIVYYIHWGNEYELEPNAMQKALARKLCDFGVDVIIGSHPHIVQKAEVLTSSTNPEHKTLCYYSMGNYISNQNRLTLESSPNKERTENGLMVQLTIRKYPDGKCMVTEVENIPTWVHRYSKGTDVYSHEIIPLASALDAPDEFGLDKSNFGASHAVNALATTNDTLGNIEEAFGNTVVLP